MKNTQFQIKINRDVLNKFHEGLEKLRPSFGRRGQKTDLIDPAIDKFIEASDTDRGLEFIEYIKSWPKN